MKNNKPYKPKLFCILKTFFINITYSSINRQRQNQILLNNTQRGFMKKTDNALYFLPRLMQKFLTRFLQIIAALSFLSGTLFAQQKSPTLSLGGTDISLAQAIDYVLRNNLTLKAAKYDVIMADTGVAQAEKKYTPQLSLESEYKKTSPLQNAQNFSRIVTQKNWDTTLAISKMFSTGTLVQAGIRNSWFMVEVGPGAFINPGPSLHRPNFFVLVQQELLKNAFGLSDRLQLDMAENAYLRQRAATIDKLSGLVVQAIVDYWAVTVQKSALENARQEEKMTRKVRNIIARNIRVGLAENFDLNQFNSLLANANAKVASAEQDLTVAKRKLLRTVNMPPETEVEGVTNLVETLPNLNKEKALDAAFSKRVDLKNARLEMEYLQNQKSLANNNKLPSAQLYGSLTTQGQNTQFLNSLQDTATLDFPVWAIGIKMSYPLWDKEIKANSRNADFSLKKAKIRMEELNLEVRDDVLNKLEKVKLAHTVLHNARTARQESELYYTRLLRKVRQGRFNSVNMKNAMDTLVLMRQKELEALVQYNVVLLQFDLAKNEIFERYNVDVEKYLAQVK